MATAGAVTAPTESVAELLVAGGEQLPVITQLYCFRSRLGGTPVSDNTAVVTPPYTPPFERLIPFSLHWYVRPTPDAVTLNVVLPPAHTKLFAGCWLMEGGLVLTIWILFDWIPQQELYTIQLYMPGIPVV